MGFPWGRFLVTDGQAWAEDGEQGACTVSAFNPVHTLKSYCADVGVCPATIHIGSLSHMKTAATGFLYPRVVLDLPSGTSKDERQVD